MLQAEFAATLSGWGWLDPSFLLYDEVASPALAAAIRSYHIFLKLVLVPGVPKIYPSPSIDLIWHTHQLLGSDYRLVLSSRVTFAFGLTHQSLPLAALKLWIW
jgi:hypothetical protein